MALGLIWGHATFRMLRTISMLQSDRASNSLTVAATGALSAGGKGRRRVAIDDGLLIVCLSVFSGLVVLGSVLMLLVWTTAALPPRNARLLSRARPLCGARR